MNRKRFGIIFWPYKFLYDILMNCQYYMFEKQIKQNWNFWECGKEGAVLYRPKPRDLNYIEKSFVISVSLLILYVSIFCHNMI